MFIDEDITNLFIILFSNFLSYVTFSVLNCLLFDIIEFSKEDWDEDARLVNEFKDGNHEAYGVLFEKYYETIYRYCFYLLSRLNDPEAAKDAMAETFEKCLIKIHTLKEVGKFFWWLRKTAYRICMDILKEKGKFVCIIEGEEDESETVFIGVKGEDIVANGRPPDIINKETMRIVREALNNLPEKYRLSVILIHYMGFSYREAAGIMAGKMSCKIEDSDIKRWVHRGLLKLREILKPYRGLSL